LPSCRSVLSEGLTAAVPAIGKMIAAGSAQMP
jgi:hypothetical protein